MANTFHPPVSSLINASDIPGDFQAFEDLVQEGIDLFLGKIFYKDLVTQISPNGVERYYSLTLLTKELKLPVLGTGMNLVFFHGSTVNMSEFPLMLDWRWEVYKYIQRFGQEGFSYLPGAFIDIFIELADIGDRQTFFGELVRTFFTDGTGDYQGFFNAISASINDYDTGVPAVTTEIQNITNQITALANEVTNKLTGSNLYSLEEIYKGYANNPALSAAVTSIETSLDNLEENHDIDIDLLGEVIRAAIGLVGDIDEKFARLADLFKTWFEGITKQDFYDLLLPQFSIELGNINAALEFPRNWLLPVELQGGEWVEHSDPAKMAALTFRIGKLKYSTYKGFEFENQLDFLFERAMIGKTGILLEFSGLKVDMSKAHNIPEADQDGRPQDFMGMYAESAVVSLPAKWFKDQDNTNAEIFGEQLLIGSGGLSGTVGLRGKGGDDTFWVKLGASNGFAVGFKSFDLKFKQNKVLSSNIAAALRIPKFVYPAGHANAGQQVTIDLTGHIQDDGDFNLTASVAPPYPIEFPGVFNYHIRSLELGEEDDKFYIGTSGKIEFLGFLKNTLKLKEIEVERLRIYSDGSVEFEGGSINLVEPIVLPLGPVEITVSAIHYGSHQKEVGGQIRKFNYFGFDGGISVDPLGVEVRGDGVKFYYCTDDLPNKPPSYLHIKTLYLDLTLPASSPAAIINGWLSIPEPGVSEEYAGGIKIQIPPAKIAGSADMKLMPKYPAFIIDASIDLPAPIPLGPVGIFGFRGLLGYRYVAEKEAVGLTSEDSWYKYYTKPPRGIHVTKFSGPNQTKKKGKPFSIGAGASLGTSFDNGTTLNLKAMVLLSLPSLFVIDGQAAILSARLGLDSPKDPPFFGFIAIDEDSLELGFGADFKLPSSSGDIVKLYAKVDAKFDFNNSSKWHVNFGTKVEPTTATIIRILNISSYLMLSAKGIEAGARGDLNFRRKYGPIKVAAWAYVEVGGKVSFERPQFGAYMAAGVGAEIDIKIISLYASFDVLFRVEAPKPFKIFGEFRFCIRIKIFWVFSFKFCGRLSVEWEFNKNIDRSPINPMLNPESPVNLGELVKGVNMLSNETFDLHYIGGNIPNNLPAAIRNTIVPLDTYIDIKSEKGLLPGPIGAIIGGALPSPKGYEEMMPPEKMVKGKEIRQVKHRYTVQSLEIKSWNPTHDTWMPYHPWLALYPNDPALVPKRAGQFQISDGRNNTIRLLATNPLAYAEQGQRHWSRPETFGLTPGHIFCQGERRTKECADFMEKPHRKRYSCRDENYLFYANQVAFLLMDHDWETEYAEVVTVPNPFAYLQSLAFENKHRLQIQLPKPSVEIELKLSTTAKEVEILYYAPLPSDNLPQVAYGHPDPNAANPLSPHRVVVPEAALLVPVLYDQPNWKAVTRIEINPITQYEETIAQLREELEATNHQNFQILLGILPGPPTSVKVLQGKIKELEERTCRAKVRNPDPIKEICDFLKTFDRVRICLGQGKRENLDGLKNCAENVLGLLEGFLNNYPNLPMLEEIKFLTEQIQEFAETPTLQGALEIEGLAESISEILTLIGGCKEVPPSCKTTLHQICWLSLEDYFYNTQLPSQAAIEEDVREAIEGITGYIQPIWRPDTSYAVRFTMTDNVDDETNPSGTYNMAFGFTTAGPVGYFHHHPEANYGDPALPDQFPLTTLTRYLDFQRSYPDPSGNILNAKPLFWDDETTRIDLFFSKPWARHFFHEWPAFNGQPAIKGRMKIVIKDPAEGSSIVNPPYLDYDPNDTTHTGTPQSIESWQDDPNPQIPPLLAQYADLLNAQNCILLGSFLIKPKSEFAHIVPKHLKPQKMYTAIVNNLYDVDKDGDFDDLDESKEVHRFTFQTSRYKSFAAQVGSYLLQDPDGPGTRPAVFRLPFSPSGQEIAAAYATVAGNAHALADGLKQAYQHPFDRVMEGIFQLPPLEAPTTTEFNLLRNSNDNDKIVAILVRNPEPFNNPRTPLSEVADTLQILNNAGNPDGNYRYLHSKDLSQVLIMRHNLNITGELDFRFRYKLWNGTNYIVPKAPDFGSDEVGTILVSNLDLSNF